MKFYVVLTFISSATLPLLVLSKPATFDSNTRLWTVSDLLFAIRYDITPSLIQVNLKSIEMQNLIRMFQAETRSLQVLSSTAKTVYIARGNAFILDAYMYAMQNRLTNVANKLTPLNDLIRTSSDDAQAIADAVGAKAITYSKQLLDKTQTEIDRYNQAVDEAFVSLETRARAGNNVSCINQAIYQTRDNTLGFYDETMSCLKDQNAAGQVYDQIKMFFDEIEGVTSQPIKRCISVSVQKRLGDIKSTENEANQCLGKVRLKNNGRLFKYLKI